MLGRSPIQCLHRWTKILRPGLKKGPWKEEEDLMLMEWVRKNGATNWSKATKVIRGRSGKQIRERWFNTLNPNVKKGEWSAAEDALIFDLYAQIGARWTQIAAEFNGRTENSIKNRFYSTLRRVASEQVRLQNQQVSRETLKTENLLSYFETARQQLQVARDQQAKDSKKVSVKHEVVEEHLEETKSPSKKRKQSPSATPSQGIRGSKTKRQKTGDLQEAHPADLNTKKENVPLARSTNSSVAARRHQKKEKPAATPMVSARVLGGESAFYSPSALQTQTSDSAGRLSCGGLHTKQETTPVLRPVPQYMNSSGSEASSVGTGGAGVDPTVKFCGNCHHTTEHMVVPMKRDGATVDEEKMEDLSRIRLLVGQYALL